MFSSINYHQTLCVLLFYVITCMLYAGTAAFSFVEPLSSRSSRSSIVQKTSAKVAFRCIMGCTRTTSSAHGNIPFLSSAILSSTNNDNNYHENEEDEDDDDENTVEPYGNRSLQWTHKYRRLIPYEEARRRVLRFGHRSKEDWDECVMNGWQGQYVPARPDEMYADEWVSWEEFLGIMRTYPEAQQLVTQILKLKSMDEYHIFVQANRERAELLRIPLKPDKVYKDSGWIDWNNFLQKDA